MQPQFRIIETIKMIDQKSGRVGKSQRSNAQTPRPPSVRSPIFTFRPDVSIGKKKQTRREAQERAKKLKNFQRDVEYQRAVQAVEPTFYC